MLKVVAQRCIELLPRNYVWSDLFQQHVTKTLRLTASQFRYKIMECKAHVENYLGVAPDPMAFSTVFELGTGWYPILPLGFYLCGASKIWTFDIRPLLRVDRVKATVRSFLALAEGRDLLEMLPWVREERLEELRRLLGKREWSSAQQMLEEVGIYVQVHDARNTGLEASSVDFIMSNGTLQHIPKDVLREIFIEFRRVASPAAVMSHLIVIADHFAGFDASITPFNYLKYSKGQWRWINNSLVPQNRLRLSDYRSIHKETGFAILQEQNTEGLPTELDSINLAPEFQHYAREDLLVLRTCIVSRLGRGLL